METKESVEVTKQVFIDGELTEIVARGGPEEDLVDIGDINCYLCPMQRRHNLDCYFCPADIYRL